MHNPALVTLCENYLTKASSVYIEGSLETRKWTDKADVERYSTEIALRPFNGTIQLLGTRSAAAADDRRAASTGAAHNQAQGRAGGSAAVADYDDEIPFYAGKIDQHGALRGPLS